MLFKISAEHFNSFLQGPWETIERTELRTELDHAKKIISIIGQCSDEDDWPDNFDFRRKAVEKWFADADIVVHSGFLRQYKAVRNKLLDIAYQYPNYSIHVSGFSLGASWTQIFVQDVLYRWPERDIQAILYAPGNPWRKLPENFQKSLESRITFVYSFWDPVTWMKLIGFQRYGANKKIGKWYRLWPIQHYPEQIDRALKDEFK